MSAWILVPVGLAVAVTGTLAVARRHLVVVRVLGDSMAPTLLAGDLVLVRRGGRRIRAGSVVVFPPPQGVLRAAAGSSAWDVRRARGPWVIKRVAALPGDAVPESVRGAVGGTAVVPADLLVLLGDGSQSTDSRTWGFLSASHVMGAVIWRLPSPAESGGVRHAAPRPAHGENPGDRGV
jgi:signal peptidase I